MIQSQGGLHQCYGAFICDPESLCQSVQEFCLEFLKALEIALKVEILQKPLDKNDDIEICICAIPRMWRIGGTVKTNR